MAQEDRRSASIRILIVVLFGVTVIVRLGASTLWADEALAWHNAHGAWSDVVRAILGGQDSGGALHATLLHFWGKIAGFSETALRIPSVIAACVTIAVLGRLARRVGADPTTTVLLAALNMRILEGAREARVYAIWLALAALYFELSTRPEPRTKRRIAAATITGAALVLAHAFGIPTFVGGVCAGGFAVPDVSWKKRILRLEVVVPALVAIAFFAIRATAVRDEIGAFWASAPLMNRLTDLGVHFLGGWGRPFPLRFVASSAFVLAGFGIMAYRRTGAIALAVACVPIVLAPVIATVLAPAGRDILLPRYFTPLLFAIVLAAARALSALPRALRLALFIAIGVLFIRDVQTTYSVAAPSGTSIRDATAWLGRNVAAEDVVIVYPWPEIVRFLYYEVPCETYALRDPASTATRVRDTLARGGHVWIALMRSPGDPTEPPPELRPSAPFAAFGPILVGRLSLR